MKILIIDDEPLVRRSLVRALSSMGHQAFEAENAFAGKEKWLELNPDLIFLDVLMPEKTGPELLTEMKGLYKGRVIIITAFSGEYEQSLTKLDVSLILKKPFENIFSELEKALQIVQAK